VIKLRAGRSRVLIPGKGKVFLCILGRRTYCLLDSGVKWTGRGATLLLTPDAEVKNERVYAHTPF